ncbi:MAG: 16S rRNA (cytosine(1402)-N(4))-methyltransferase RsmH [Verrucomicrobiota bacterium]
MHIPVLLKEVIEVLQPSAGKVFLDGTFGCGGHTEAFLKAGAKVLGCDQDAIAIGLAEEKQKAWGEDKLKVRKMNFRELEKISKSDGPFDAVFADLGVSSPQLDHADRGFSFMNEGPLDMRMDRSLPLTAKDLVLRADESDLSEIILKYGEERRAKQVAKAIVSAREKNQLETTKDLARCVESVIKRRKGQKIHPATKVFQGLRIAVNEELDALGEFLDSVPNALKTGGRLGVISFHALEDRMVKRKMALWSEEEIRGERVAFGKPNPEFCMKKVGRWLPNQKEIESNPRARSARLRVVEKII